MIKRALVVVFFALFLFLVLFQSKALAQLNSIPTLPKLPHLPEFPDRSGLYVDPQHPDIHVRVFVHPGKPESTTIVDPVCGLEDPDSQSVVGAGGWHLPQSWTYNLNPSSVPSTVGSSNLPTISANGFSDWASAVANKVSFTKGQDTTTTRSSYDGKNIITWGRTSGSALGVTYIRYFSSSGLAVDVDTIMNKKFLWRWSNSSSCAYPDSYDAENILNHELGHWVGLNDEYDAANFQHATMYGYGAKGEVKKNTLSTGDASGASAIYP